MEYREAEVEDEAEEGEIPLENLGGSEDSSVEWFMEHQGGNKERAVINTHNVVADGWAGASNPHPHP